MTALTEAEIREAVDAIDIIGTTFNVGDVVYELARPLRYFTPDEYPVNHGLWDDLRPSQADRLGDLLEEIYVKADRIIEEEVFPRIREMVIEAALTFAAEYPDAPRAKVAVPA